jgi:serine/threonine protein kinase
VRTGLAIVGKYRLVRRLGAGGMGVVWEASHLVTGRPFAIKFLSSPEHAEHYARFLLEAKVSGLVRHPSIVDVYDVGTAPELKDTPFLVMELLDGLSLSEVLAATGRLSLRQALALMLPLLSGITAAHEAGVLHRDLKPSNLFLHRLPAAWAGAGSSPALRGVVPKILDFGISKLVGPARDAEPEREARHRLTRTGTVIGSPLYMSPEQVRGETTLDARSDIHAMGAILWECLSGKLLFSANLDDRELAAQISNGARPELSLAWPECPAGLSAILGRAVALRKEDRFASARELHDELDRLRAELGIAVSLTDPKDALEIFPILAPSDPRKGLEKASLERATTVDSQFPPPSGDTSDAAAHSDAPVDQARSLAAWGEKERATGTRTTFKRRWQSILAVVAVGSVLVLGVLQVHRSEGSHDVPPSVAASPSPPAPALPPPPPPSPSAPVPLEAPVDMATPAASPLPTPSARLAPAPHDSPPKNATRNVSPAPHADAHPAAGVHDAGAESIGTSANGAPIIR